MTTTRIDTSEMRSRTAERLAAVAAGYPVSQSKLVGEVMHAVIEVLGDATHDKQLLLEVEELGRTIAHAKQEIANMREESAPAGSVTDASDELDAVVAHTADATNTILEVCETLDQAAAIPGGPTAQMVTDATSHIYEACSFQDIAGQRITKVVATLKVIEAKVAKIVATFGQQSWDALTPRGESGPGRPDAHLLNGPQMASAAMGQTDIDAMLADF